MYLLNHLNNIMFYLLFVTQIAYISSTYNYLFL